MYKKHTVVRFPMGLCTFTLVLWIIYGQIEQFMYNFRAVSVRSCACEVNMFYCFQINSCKYLSLLAKVIIASIRMNAIFPYITLDYSIK